MLRQWQLGFSVDPPKLDSLAIIAFSSPTLLVLQTLIWTSPPKFSVSAFFFSFWLLKFWVAPCHGRAGEIADQHQSDAGKCALCVIGSFYALSLILVDAIGVVLLFDVLEFEVRFVLLLNVSVSVSVCEFSLSVGLCITILSYHLVSVNVILCAILLLGWYF